MTADRRRQRILTPSIGSRQPRRRPAFDAARAPVPLAAQVANNPRLALEQRIALQGLRKIGDYLVFDLVRLDALRRSVSEETGQPPPRVLVRDPGPQRRPGRRQLDFPPLAHDLRAGQVEGRRQQRPDVRPSSFGHARRRRSHDIEPPPQGLGVRRDVDGKCADEPRDLADGGHEIVPPLALQTLQG